MSETLDVYFDFRSPYAYFAAALIARGDFTLPAGIAWCWRPISINVLLNLQAGRSPTAVYVDPLAPAKRGYVFEDVAHASEHYAIPYRVPEPLRPDTVPAMALFADLAAEPAVQGRLLSALFEAVWCNQNDVGDPTVLAEVAASVAVPAAAIERACAPEARAALVADSVRSYETAGVFGVPTFVWRRQRFFGVDHLAMACAAVVRARRAA